MTPPLIVCMGVSGSGKSTLAEILAKVFNLTLIEADDFHSPENKKKMNSGQPLTDENRKPWMEKVCKELSTKGNSGEGCVLAHSGLRKMHRQQIREVGLQTLFLYLDAPHETLARRMIERNNHYMPVGLLGSQFAAFQSTESERDVIRLDATLSRYKLVTRATATVEHFLETLENTGGNTNALSLVR